MKKKLVNLIPLICMFILYACSASTGGRYSNDEGQKEKNETTTKKPANEVKEDFDFTPYRTKLDIPEKKLNFPTSSKNSDIWYGYEDKTPDTLSQKKIINKVSGYRVLVFTSDNLEDADSMRSNLYFKTTQKQVYITFDPPFYKVSVGDFKYYSNANNLSFKLKQMGYGESRVVTDSINVYEQ